MSDHTYVLSGITLHDLGILVRSSQRERPDGRPLVPPGVLFYTTSIDEANDQDNHVLRDRLQIRTIIDVRYHQPMRYYRDMTDGNPRYIPEMIGVEDVLGVTNCRVHLRYGPYNDACVRELSLWTKMKLSWKVSAHSPEDPPLLQYISKIQAQTEKSPIQDTFALLKASGDIIGKMFNTVIAQPNAFPILICGDCLMTDSSILILLFLSLLEVPDDAIENVIVEVNPPRKSKPRKMLLPGMPEANQKPDSQGRQPWAAWVKEVRELVEQQYGSVDGYLLKAGVTEVAKRHIKEAVLAAAPEKSDFLTDIDQD